MRIERLLADAVSKLRERHDELLKTDLTAFHCSIIVSGGKVISVGMNKQKVNSFVSAFAHHPNVGTIHAEIDSILRVRKKIDLTGCKVFVAKLGRNNVIGNSTPCKMCMDVLKNYGIKKVYYTIDENTYCCKKLNALE